MFLNTSEHDNQQGRGLAWLWLIPLTGLVALVLFVVLPQVFPSTQPKPTETVSAEPAKETAEPQSMVQTLAPLPPKPPAYDFPAEGAKQVIILMYHNVVPNPGNRFEISTQAFAEQLDLLASVGCRVIPLSCVIDALEKHDFSKLPARPVVITVDDGYENFYTNAYPLLRERNMPAALSIYTSFIGSCRAALKWEQLKELVASGWIEIASHSTNHTNLSKEQKGETPEQLAARRQLEIEGSKKTLEEKLGIQVVAFVYPGGNRNTQTDELVQKAGYKGALTIYDGPNLPADSPFKLRRYGIYPNTTLEMLNNYLTGARVADSDFHVGKPLKKEQKKQTKSQAKVGKTKPAKKPEPDGDKLLKRPGTYH